MKGMWIVQGKTRINLANVHSITPDVDEGRVGMYFATGWHGVTIDPAKPVQLVSNEQMLQLLRAELIVEQPQ